MNTKIFKMYQLGHADACFKKRAFPLFLEERKSDAFDRAVAVKSILTGYYAGDIMYDDIEKALHDAFEPIAYKSKQQKLVQERECLKQIMRYIDSEKREPVPVHTKQLAVYPDFTVVVSPDYYFINGDELELVKIKCSQPNLSQKAASTDLGLYSMLFYADKLAFELKDESITKVKASYYFLGKKNDSNGEKPNFDTDFFKTTGGLNIVSVSDRVGLVKSIYRMGPYIKSFLEGIPETECSKSDCERCEIFDMCKYTEPPIAIKKETKERALSGISLTREQTKAINYDKGICRINAGAGAGKTMVIALRTATLINKGVKPEELCLITFTNAGAEEMRTRISLYLKEFGNENKASEIAIKTFNSFGDDIIREEYKKLGFSEIPSVIDDVERSHIIAALLEEEMSLNPDSPLKELNWKNFAMDSKYVKGALVVAKNVFDIMKRHGYSVSDSFDIAVKLGISVSEDTVKELAKLYNKYDNRLRSENLVEFADQEAMVFEILHNEPYYFEKFGFKHIIVDEMQDSSKEQIEMLKLLTETPSFESLMIVGDDSQSIFGFRETTPEYIINFEKYIGGKVDDIFLLENHRSTPEIIDFANKINANNVNRVIKDLVATRESGKPVTVKGFLTPEEERQFVIEKIKEHLKNGTKPEDMAVICYSKAEISEMADALEKEGISSISLNPEPLIKNSRVRAAISFVFSTLNPFDEKDLAIYANALSGGKFLNMSLDEMDDALAGVKATIEKFHATEDVKEKKAVLMEALKAIDHNEDEVYESFLETLERKNIFKILEYVEEFELYGAKNTAKRNHTYSGVVLTTAHSSKGLEWNVVFDMISKYHTSSLKGGDIEERRRLLFVSSTRARDELFITGQYTAYGKRGDYTYNKFLVESYNVLGQDFNITEIEAERTRREKIRKAEKEKEKKEEGKNNACVA